MVEILPITSLREEDSLIFGNLNVLLANLHGLGIPVAKGYIVSPPRLHLQTVLKNYDFGSHQVFEQSLTLVRKELAALSIPKALETLPKSHFLLRTQVYQNVKDLWMGMLDSWLLQVKEKLWANGFSEQLTSSLPPLSIILVEKVSALGMAFIDPEHESVIKIEQGKLDHRELYKLDQVVGGAQKKLLINYQFRWILDKDIKICEIIPYNNSVILKPKAEESLWGPSLNAQDDSNKISTKVFLDLSDNLIVEHDVEGVFIDSNKVFNLSSPEISFEELIFKIVEAAITFPNKPVLMKLADVSEGHGKMRGTLRLIHQESLLNPLVEAVKFAKEKKELSNIHLIIPFVRGVYELMEIKKLLALKKLTRKRLQHWLELAVPENLSNIEDYLTTGIDGVVVNLDELVAHFNGFDPEVPEVTHYKHEISGLIKFLEEPIKLLHKSSIPFLAHGSLTLNPEMLDFLVKTGVNGVIASRFETSSMKELLYKTERRIILDR